MSSSFITDSTPAGDFEQITVSSTALGATATKVSIAQAGGYTKRAVRAFVSVETDAIRIRFDGTAPTASVGHKVASGDNFVVEGEQNVSNLKMIRVSTDATVNISFWYNR